VNIAAAAAAAAYIPLSAAAAAYIPLSAAVAAYIPLLAAAYIPLSAAEAACQLVFVTVESRLVFPTTYGNW
jgi:hypothetical protein